LKPEQILITGAIGTTLKDGSQKQHVGMYGLDHLGKIIFEYEKIHLVPFGEYIPLKKLLPIQKLSKSIMDLDYSPGEINRTFLLGNLKAIPLICYEIIFSEEVRSRNHLADLIINITNDAWYGNSSGPYQHFRIAQMRAVENGIPVLRVANNGISAIIDPLGRIIMQTKLDEETYIDGYIPNKLTKSTIFASSPQLIFLFLLVLIIYTNELMKLKWIKI
jgi:apolipoprotein N-acyltransferase